MIIGSDFDNTIIDYDEVFYRVACERGLISEDVEPTKEKVRNYLREANRENLWTELQGYVYGPGILRARPFEGARDFFAKCKSKKIPVIIVSHKTKYPFLGPKYDLHAHALSWMERNIFDSSLGLSRTSVFLELTREEKMKRIAYEKCTHFIDDLPELFLEEKFPSNVLKILFDPRRSYVGNGNFVQIRSWKDFANLI